MNNIFILNPPFIFRRSLSLKWSFSFKIFLVFSILLLVLLLGFYVFQVNTEVSERYSIQKYERQISEISKENKNLEIQAVQTASLDKIAELLEPLNFQKTDKIHYIRILDTKVVAK